MDTNTAWIKLRRQLERERRSYQVPARNKDARVTFAALEGAYGGVLRMMDRLERTCAE
jgi:hypothetical protein